MGRGGAETAESKQMCGSSSDVAGCLPFQFASASSASPRRILLLPGNQTPSRARRAADRATNLGLIPRPARCSVEPSARWLLGPRTCHGPKGYTRAGSRRDNVMHKACGDWRPQQRPAHLPLPLRKEMEMFGTRTRLVIWGMAVVLLAVETRSQDGPPPGLPPGYSTPPRITSAQELWDNAHSLRLLNPPPPPPTAPPPSNAAYWWFTTFLGSKDPEIRDAAAEIVAKSKRAFGVGEVLQYLGPENPPNVRMAALRWTIGGWHFSKDHVMEVWWDPNDREQKEQRDRELKAAGEAFNELFKADVTPPFAAEVLLAMGGEQFPIAKSLQPLVARRLLAVHSGCMARSGNVEGPMCAALRGMDPTIVAREAAAWYRIEPSARMRRDMLTFIRFEDMKALKPLYEVGTKDWDTDNANLAKEQLELLRSTRGPAGRDSGASPRFPGAGMYGPMPPPLPRTPTPSPEAGTKPSRSSSVQWGQRSKRGTERSLTDAARTPVFVEQPGAIGPAGRDDPR